MRDRFTGQYPGIDGDAVWPRDEDLSRDARPSGRYIAGHRLTGTRWRIGSKEHAPLGRGQTHASDEGEGLWKVEWMGTGRRNSVWMIELLMFAGSPGPGVLVPARGPRRPRNSGGLAGPRGKGARG